MDKSLFTLLTALTTTLVFAQNADELNQKSKEFLKGDTKNAVPKGESYLSFTGNGAWCWFSDPRAIYFKGQHSRTYVGWVDSFGNIVIGFYDHDLKRIEMKVLHKNLERDDHDNPSLFIDKQGNLLFKACQH